MKLGKQSKQEEVLREKLGIPVDARKVILFAESSHWDPDWLLTSKQYYTRFVRRNLDMALKELVAEPGRIFSIECIFFLKMYWERNPEKQNLIRDLINQGRLRLTSSGMTTADTLVPTAEAILRDFLIGQEWLRENGMEQEPTLAYFPDSFGYSHALPALLNAAGFTQTAITRVDGMFFTGCEFTLSSKGYPLPGSTAELLQKKEKSMDFIWRAKDGAEVLAHWNAFTYGMGDLLAHSGMSRVYLFPAAISNRADSHVARRIKQYVQQLEPLSNTPYLFCPIGTDFIPPIHGLVELLDRYNRNHFPETGGWAVNAGLDDYLDLVDCYRKNLPVIDLDPNPYWTGFYTSRPALKRSAHDLVKKLLHAETQTLVEKDKKAARKDQTNLKDIWQEMIVSNHHDFITGTSPDRVVEWEQKPLLLNAHRRVDTILRHQPISHLDTPKKQVKSPTWKREMNIIRIATDEGEFELDESFPGKICRVISSKRGKKSDLEPLIELVDYRDGGGLWRMGNEFPGVGLKEIPLRQVGEKRVEIKETSDGLWAQSIYEHGRTSVKLGYRFLNADPLIQITLEGKVAPGHTLCFRIHAGLQSKSILMDEPGGMIERAWHKIYSPTFWPFQSFALVQEKNSKTVFRVDADMPGAVSWNRKGQMEVVGIRNATHEKGYGFIIVPGLPIGGHEISTHHITFTIHDNVPKKNCLTLEVGQLTLPVHCDNPAVKVSAVKPAWRGEGWIIRLETLEVPKKPIQISLAKGLVKKAWLSDARERDIQGLKITRGRVTLKMPRSIATIRLLA